MEEVLKGCAPFARVIPSHFKENGGDGHHMVTWSHGHPNLFKLDHIICFTFYNQLLMYTVTKYHICFKIIIDTSLKHLHYT